MNVVTRASQFRSLHNSKTSAVQKYFTALAGALPSGLSCFAATSAGMLCG